MIKAGQFIAYSIVTVFLLLTAGCASPEDTADNGTNNENGAREQENEEIARDEVLSEDGFEIHLPQDWTVAERSTSSQDTVEIVLESSRDERGKTILSYFPRAYFSEEEVKEEAERVLTSSLYHMEGDIERDSQEVAGKQVTVFSAAAGEREPMLARSAAISGKSGHAILTLINREEAEDYFSPYLGHLIKGLDID